MVLLFSVDTSDQGILVEQMNKILFCFQTDVTFIKQEYIRDCMPTIE